MSKEIEYAFLGGIFPKDLQSEVKEKSIGNIQYAANTLQWNLINGIESNISGPIKLFNRMFIGSFPNKYKDFYIKTKVFSHEEGACDINIGFINVLFIKQLLIPKVANKYLLDWINDNNDKKKVLFVYSSNFLESITFVKKIDSSVHICLILPDLPSFMNMDKSNSILYKCLNRSNQKALLNNIRYIDSFVILTDQMAEVLSIKNKKPHVVIEGMVSDSNSDINQNDNDIKVNTICYTGTLTKKYGIMDLVKAFRLIENEEYRLVICGSGEAEAEIKKIALNDPRIEYKGIIPREEAIKIQKNSTVLVNPRKNNEIYTKYSFPSKIMEYMIAGRPIVCYKLDGMPDEYDDFLNYVHDNSIESLKNKLVEVVSMKQEELINQGIKNRNFVLENKNNNIQAKKILQMIDTTLIK
ncbi:glycosyltransferase [Peptoclostridium litorale]|nr:glycosyltransferase [Peptoclostridium litorale]